MSYYFETGKVFDLEDEVMMADKYARGVGETWTSVRLPTIPVVYRNGTSRVSLECVQRDYDKYRGMQSGRDEASREVDADDVSLEELLEQEFL